MTKVSIIRNGRFKDSFVRFIVKYSNITFFGELDFLLDFDFSGLSISETISFSGIVGILCSPRKSYVK